MIFATLLNISRQVVPSPRMVRALQFLQETDLNTLPEGRFPVEGNDIFAIVSSYLTIIPQPMVELEGHKKYIDIQYVVSGKEMVGWHPSESVPVSRVYDPEKDFWNGERPGNEITWFTIKAGEAAILFPSDAHAPQMACDESIRVKKVVVKVAL